MERYYLDHDASRDPSMNSPEELHHMNHVKRTQVGDIIELFDRLENEYTVQVVELSDDRMRFKILETLQQKRELNTNIYLYQGIPKAKKMEWIIQKCTELGVHSIIPVQFRRCVVDLRDKEQKRLERWNKIAQEAAKQAKRNHIPKILSSVSLNQLSDSLAQHDLVILCYELEKERTLKSVIEKSKDRSIGSIGVVIGPEGGLERSEVAQIMELPQAQTVTLGDRILRTETCGIYLTGVLGYEFE